ncbi:hypothetical protein DFH27DRAFT_524859 [Peziza echinospora]|nr:hypothetical protein DFH27DRAFT_524859 [Peziza echinospora]
MSPQLPKNTRQWILSKNPDAGDAPSQFFSLVDRPLDPTPANGITVKTLYISNDPAQRTWLSKFKTYVDPVKVGEPMRALALGEVVASNNSRFSVGDWVYGMMSWSEYLNLEDPQVQKLSDEERKRPEEFIASRMTALTAYYGLLKIAEATEKDQTIVVSSAAGATGSYVLQIAKNVLKVKNVVGIAGSEEKVALIKSLGCDVALNYKSPTFAKDLKAAVPNGIDVYFDNVGGDILDLCLSQMKQYGRIAACGSISGYVDNGQGQGVKNWFQIISKSLTVRGFIVFDFAHDYENGQKEFDSWVRDGKIKVLNTVYETNFEGIPGGMQRLLDGKNTGKLVTKLSML